MHKKSTTFDFYVGAIFVFMQSLLGFLGFKPSSADAFYIAVIASIAIPMGFCMKWDWARWAAMLSAVFGIIVGVADFAGSAMKAVVCLMIAFHAFVFVWLRRKGLRECFTPSASGQSSNDTE